MSEFIQGFQTTEGEKKYDYNALGNLPDLTISKEDITGALGFVPTSKAEVEASVKIASDAAATADNKAVAAQSTANQAVSAAQQAQSTADDAVQAAQNAQNRADDAHERIDDSYSQIVQGSVITIDDCDNAPLQNLRVFGKTTQKTTTGKNLYGFEEITFTRRKVVYLDNPLPAGTYAVSAVVISDDPNNGACIATFLNEDNSSRKILQFGRNTRDVEILSVDFPVAEIWFMSSISYNSSEGYTATWSQLQIEAGSTPTDYEPYTGGIPSPNPDYPQPLESVGDDGNIGVTVVGKNLWRFEDMTYVNGSNMGITKTDTGIIATSNNTSAYSYARYKWLPVSLLEGKNITISAKTTKSGGAIPLLKVVYLLEDGTSEDIKNINSSTQSISFLVDGKAASKQVRLHIGFLFYANAGGTVAIGDYSEYTNIQIEVGETATEYEPCKGKTLTTSTPNGLPGLKIPSGGNYTDADDQQWICDEVDFARGKYVQRIGQDKLSSLSWSYSTTAEAFMAGTSKTNITAYKDLPPLLCDCYSVVETRSAQYWANHPDLSIGFRTDGLLMVKDSRYADVESFKAGAGDTIIYYVLKEPIETPLSAEELAQYAALHTSYLNTIIFNDGNVHMEVQYATPTTVLSLSGGRMNGSIDMVNHQLTGLPTPKNNTDAVSLEYLQETKLELAQGINDVSDIAYGAQETADEALEKAVDAHERIDDSQVQVVKGEVVSVGNSADAPLQGLRIFGKTTQNTTTGKNLFGGDALKKKLIEVANATVETDGTVRFYCIDVNNKVLFENFLPNTQYTIVLKGRNSFGAGTNLAVSYTDGTTGYLNFPKSKEDSICLFTTAVNKSIDYIKGVYYEGYTNLYALECGIFEGIITLDDFEPYTGGIPSPNPDYPQPLESVGDGGSVGMMLYGKNILPNRTKSQTINGITFTVNNDGSITANGTATSIVYFYLNDESKITLEGGGKYIVNGCPKGGSSETYCIQAYSKELQINVNDFGNGCAVEKTGNYNVIIVIKSGVTVNKVTFYPMIRSAFITDNTYEPYTETAATISIPNGLSGIPVSSGGNYTDENGKQWICDEVDFARGKYVQRIGKYTFDGTESLIYQISYTDYKWYGFSISGMKNVGDVYNNSFISDAFSYRGSTGNILGAFRRYNEFRFSVPINETAKSYIVGFSFIYELKTPVEHDLNAEQLTQYSVLHTNYPNTTIFNDSGAGMEVQYATPTTALSLTGGRYKVATPYAPTDAVPKSYADRIDKKVDTLREVVSSFHSNIVQEASGEVIQVHGSAEAPLAGLKVFGKTEQFTSTGKNLLDLSNPVIGYNLDESGIAVANDTFKYTNLNPLPVGKYTFSIHSTSASANTRIHVYNASDNWMRQADVITGSGSLTFDIADGEYGVKISTKADNYKLQIEAGETATDYEPYTGGIPGPNPDYPLPLESVGDSGNVGVTVVGKNLFGGDVFADKLVSVANGTKDEEKGTVYVTGSQIASKVILEDVFKENTPYTIILKCHSVSTGYTSILIRYTDGTTENITGLSANVTKTLVKVTNANKTVKSLAGTNRTNSTFYYHECGLFEGVLTAEDFEPYKDGGSLSISTPNGLSGIPVTSGGNYIDENGQQWICDEVDFARGKYVQRIGGGKLTDITKWNAPQVLADIDEWRLIGAPVPSNWYRNNTAYKNGRTKGLFTHGQYHEYWGISYYTHAFMSLANVYVVVPKEKAVDSDTFKAWVTAQADAGNVPEIMVALDNDRVVERDLSAEQLTQYAALHTNYPNTTILNDNSASMNVKYVADTKMYVDKKFEELAEILVNKL